jgi:uncharacterized protein (DUF433 family)
MKLARITIDPHQMEGVPCIRSMHLPVAAVVGMLAKGMTEDEILQAFPDLERADVCEASQSGTDNHRE